MKDYTRSSTRLIETLMLPTVYLSNQQEILFQHLIKNLFENRHPFSRRLIIVESPMMKLWLQKKMAEDPEVGIAFGIEILPLEPAIKKILSHHSGYLPSFSEIAFAVQSILSSLHLHDPTSIPTLHDQDKSTKKWARKLTRLSLDLAKLFINYGKYNSKVIEQDRDWQGEVWRTLYSRFDQWGLPGTELDHLNIHANTQVHLFGISHLPKVYLSLLEEFSEKASTHLYFLSACQKYWGDIRSQKESGRLVDFWEEKGALPTQCEVLSELLADTNPLLATWGKIGRDFFSQLDHTECEVIEDYSVSKSSLERIAYAELIDGEMRTKEGEFNLLRALQTDILLLRNPKSSEPIEIDSADRSLQVHLAPTLFREVEVIYHEILHLLDTHGKDKEPLEPCHIQICCPNMQDYLPALKAIFESEQHKIPYSIVNRSLLTDSPFIKVFLSLLDLASGRFESAAIMQIISSPYFMRKQDLNRGDVEQIKKWVKKLRVYWGRDAEHKEKLLKDAHCFGSGDKIGTWENAINRLLGCIAYSSDPYDPDLSIGITQMDLLGKFISHIRSLFHDLSTLASTQGMTLKEWVIYLKSLLKTYLAIDEEDTLDSESEELLVRQIETLSIPGEWLSDEKFPFITIRTHLERKLAATSLTDRDSDFQSMMIGTPEQLHGVPARVMIFLGMDESTFPQKSQQSTIDLLQQVSSSERPPNCNSLDRYYFLEALLGAQDYFILSYTSLALEDGHEQNPSILIEELFSYLERYFIGVDHSIISHITYKHPFHAFDSRYFEKDSKLKNYSKRAFEAVKEIHKDATAKCFFSDVSEKARDTKKVLVIDIKDLIVTAKDPVKLYLNKTLNLYPKVNLEPDLSEDEPLSLNNIDRFHIEQAYLKKPFENTLDEANIRGYLPAATLGRIAQAPLQKSYQLLQQMLTMQEIKRDDIFQLELCEGCDQAEEISPGRVIAPPLVLTVGESTCYFVGKLDHMTPKGLLKLTKTNKHHLLYESWPVYLLLQFLSPSLSEELKRTITPDVIFFDKDKGKIISTIKKPRFSQDEALQHLERFLHYHQNCQAVPSPLLSKWVEYFLLKKSPEISQKLIEELKDKSSFISESAQYAFGAGEIFSDDSFILKWSEQAEEMYSQPYELWRK